MTDPLASLPRLGRLHLTAADVVTRLWQYGVSGEWPAGRHVRFNGEDRKSVV